MNDIEKQLKSIKDALDEIKRELNPTCSPGIASDLSAKMGNLGERLDKIEKKLGI